VERAGPAAVGPADDAGLLHVLELPLGVLKLGRVQAARLGRQRRPGSLQVMLYIMLGCRKFPFVLSYILELSKEASVLRRG
jgi:hypothetical protein